MLCIQAKETFYLVLALRKPKEPVAKLFEYKKNLLG